MISEMNSRSPRVVGILRPPTRSASGYFIASQVITARVEARAAKKIAVGSVQAIHAIFSMAPSLHPAKREAARDVIADEPDHQRPGNNGENAGCGQQAPIHSGGRNR